MKTHYQPLCQLQLQHGYYSGNNSINRDPENFRVYPTPACQRILTHHNIIFRQTNNGMSLYIAVVPGTDPPELFQKLNTDTLRLSFWLEITNPVLFNISALPAEYRAGKELFYFSNLTGDLPAHVDGEPLYLNDHSVANSLGSSIKLLTSLVHTFRFEPGVSSALLTLQDQFGNTIKTISVNEVDTVSEFRINLDDIPGLLAGYYTLSDDHGNTEHFYFDPELMGKPVFAMVELFNTTKNLTADHSDKVAPHYQFISAGNTLSQDASYLLKLNSRESIWRYIITRKYQNTGLDLNDLSVSYKNDNSLSFGKSLTADQVTFTANKTLPIQAKHQPVVLQQAGKADINLPNPTASTALQHPPGLSHFSSDIYVYV